MASIDFIPRRINDPPIVFRGMTLREIVMISVCGFISGLFPGTVMAFVLGMFPMAPTVAVVWTFLLIMMGGAIFKRLRRGRPSSLLYQQIHYTLASNGIHVGKERLITCSSSFSVVLGAQGRGGIK